MKSFALCVISLIVALVLSQASAGWTIFCDDYSCPNTIVDVAPIKTQHGYSACIAGGYSSGSADRGSGIWCATKPDLSDLSRLQHYDSALMYVAIATSSDMKTVVTSGIGLLNNTHLMYSSDPFTTAFNSKAALGAYGQDIKSVKTLRDRAPERQLFSSVGTLDVMWGGRGLFLSENSGRSYFNRTWSDIQYGDARYNHGVDTPSGVAIYVSGGTWPAAASEHQERLDLLNRCIRLSAHICQPAPPNMPTSRIQEANSVVYSQSKRDYVKSTPNAGHRGLLTVTHDAGETWEILFDTDEFYFNDIFCSSVEHCVAVGENSTNGYIYSTEDSGKTWTQRLRIQSQVLVSFFRVRFVSGRTWYATGGWYNEETEALEGLIYKSIDDGKTWQLDFSIPEVAIIMGLNFSPDGTVGYAVGSTQASLAIIARFDAE